MTSFTIAMSQWETVNEDFFRRTGSATSLTWRKALLVTAE
jgi:hypothetical protein